mmetsp:Transcript_118352/g.342150  ORF Transcript_118352/g.342150 Transcript_118352/m.342150 type:complete len:297 (-) Transcript_118352:1966-2856(-)
MARGMRHNSASLSRSPLFSSKTFETQAISSSDTLRSACFVWICLSFPAFSSRSSLKCFTCSARSFKQLIACGWLRGRPGGGFAAGGLPRRAVVAGPLSMSADRGFTVAPSERFRMAPSVSSMRSLPFRKTSTIRSLAASPAPASLVVHCPSFSSSVKRPVLAPAPITTSMSFPRTRVYEHLKAAPWGFPLTVFHCPVQPNVTLSAAQPLSRSEASIVSKPSESMPLFWTNLMQDGSNLKPVGVFSEPYLVSSASSTFTNGSTLSAASRRTRTQPSRFSITDFNSPPQTSLQALIAS